VEQKLNNSLKKTRNRFNPVKSEFAEILYSDSDNEDVEPLILKSQRKEDRGITPRELRMQA